jgi:hypothetical protein
VSRKNKRRGGGRPAGAVGPSPAEAGPTPATPSGSAQPDAPARGPGGGRIRRTTPAAPPPRPAGRGLLATALGAFRARPIAGGAAEVVAVETAPEPEPTTPLGKARRYADRHPLLISWIVLAVGMVAILVYTSRDVGLLPSQLLAMIVATILLAGACVWIISWE